MNEIRSIRRIVTGKPATDGAGVKLVRVIGYNDTQDFDPFLMLDAFDSTNPEDYVKGFPWHPHRGIETITYLIRGDIAHGDSLGNKGRILDGECQWMTAGSGILHQEMPKASERMLGTQLWLNLPAKDKMTEPKYNDIVGENVPTVAEEGLNIRIISGNYKGTDGAFRGEYADALYLDAEMAPGAEWLLETDPEATLFIYIVQGAGFFGPSGEGVAEKHAVLFDKGNAFRAKASEAGARIFLMAAKPLGEPIAWGGPIVMNTREELDLAFRELQEGTFIKR
ncbi:MAG TPA: pirin family protein [Synergistales bacterium]|nr:pirin family protein [Synergistales bacterium]